MHLKNSVGLKLIINKFTKFKSVFGLTSAYDVCSCNLCCRFNEDEGVGRLAYFGVLRSLCSACTNFLSVCFNACCACDSTHITLDYLCFSEMAADRRELAVPQNILS